MSYETVPEREPGPLQVNRYRDQPTYTGFPTFMRLPVCLSAEDLRAGRIDAVVVGVPWDGTQVSRSGSHRGPRGIREADYYPSPADGTLHQHVRVDPLRELRVADYGDVEVVVADHERTFSNIRTMVSEIASEGVIPMVLGGDHGITWPNVTGLADVYGFGQIGVVHFDSHADTADSQMGVPAGHGCPMRRLMESGAVPGANFVQVGLRGYWPDEALLLWMEEQGMRCHFMAEIENRGFGSVLDDVISEAAEHADRLFISVDVDVLDPAQAPGTGSPEPGGLTSRELLHAVRRLAAEVGIVGLDVVEVAPNMDPGNQVTALLAHRVVLEGLTGIAMRRRGLTSPDYLHPRAANGPTWSAETQSHGMGERGE